MTEGPNFHPETLQWLNNASLSTRQSFGQYMTPRFLRTYLLDQLDIKAGHRILDPAVGTGEFLAQAVSTFPCVSVAGWDIDQDILEVAKQVVPEAQLELRSGLEPYNGEKYDFVIGNPPYFEMKLNES